MGAQERLAAAFSGGLTAAGGSAATEATEQDLEPRLAAAHARGCAAFPELELGDEAFARHLGARERGRGRRVAARAGVRGSRISPPRARPAHQAPPRCCARATSRSCGPPSSASCKSAADAADVEQQLAARPAGRLRRRPAQDRHLRWPGADRTLAAGGRPARGADVAARRRGRDPRPRRRRRRDRSPRTPRPRPPSSSSATAATSRRRSPRRCRGSPTASACSCACTSSTAWPSSASARCSASASRRPRAGWRARARRCSTTSRRRCTRACRRDSERAGLAGRPGRERPRHEPVAAAQDALAEARGRSGAFRSGRA